jgi:hypothetical protein
MSMQINVGDHISPEAGFIAIPSKYRPTMRWARTHAKWVTKNKPAADVFYRTLSGGRSLTQLLADRSIWINYHATRSDYGYQSTAHPKEVAISNLAFRVGRWTVMATLVHELAHVNGAPGGASKQAEHAVLACGLGKGSELSSGVTIRSRYLRMIVTFI